MALAKIRRGVLDCAASNVAVVVMSESRVGASCSGSAPASATDADANPRTQSPADPDAPPVAEPMNPATVEIEPTNEGVTAFGPIARTGGITGFVENAPVAGIAMQYGTGGIEDGAFRISGDARAYLVRNHGAEKWVDHSYVRLNLVAHPLTFSLDLSRVPCGCLACICAQTR